MALLETFWTNVLHYLDWYVRYALDLWARMTPEAYLTLMCALVFGGWLMLKSGRTSLG